MRLTSPYKVMYQFPTGIRVKHQEESPLRPVSFNGAHKPAYSAADRLEVSIVTGSHMIRRAKMGSILCCCWRNLKSRGRIQIPADVV